jgi:hypothetical protein
MGIEMNYIGEFTPIGGSQNTNRGISRIYPSRYPENAIPFIGSLVRVLYELKILETAIAAAAMQTLINLIYAS